VKYEEIIAMSDASDTAARVVENRIERYAYRRWAVILAGGNGSRLLPLTRRITGDDRPKQFCVLVGSETLLQQTKRRVSQILPPYQTLIALTRAHEGFYAGEVADMPSSNMLIKHYNKGTAPAILYSLMRVREMDPEAIVSFFPSDHHIEDDEAFVASIESAFVEAASRPKSVVLLGIAPDNPEPQYGWIEPGPMLPSHTVGPIYRVSQFWEKPSPAFAEELMARGCLWNCFVMVGHVKAFLNLFDRTLPSLTNAFESIRQSFSTEAERGLLRGLYSRIREINFSSEVLSAHSHGSVYPCDLSVLRGNGLGWSDLGEPSRVFSVLRGKGVEPEHLLVSSGQPLSGSRAGGKASPRFVSSERVSGRRAARTLR
jgi:mannose-1-phosphate guanylyltransferase